MNRLLRILPLAAAMLAASLQVACTSSSKNGPGAPTPTPDSQLDAGPAVLEPAPAEWNSTCFSPMAGCLSPETPLLSIERSVGAPKVLAEGVVAVPGETELRLFDPAHPTGVSLPILGARDVIYLGSQLVALQTRDDRHLNVVTYELDDLSSRTELDALSRDASLTSFRGNGYLVVDPSLPVRLEGIAPGAQVSAELSLPLGVSGLRARGRSDSTVLTWTTPDGCVHARWLDDDLASVAQATLLCPAPDCALDVHVGRSDGDETPIVLAEECHGSPTVWQALILGAAGEKRGTAEIPCSAPARTPIAEFDGDQLHVLVGPVEDPSFLSFVQHHRFSRRDLAELGVSRAPADLRVPHGWWPDGEHGVMLWSESETGAIATADLCQ